MRKRIALTLCLALVAGLVVTFAPGIVQGQSQTITVYSGRSESLVGPIIEEFTKETGIKVQVRYGDTAELAATILEEGRNTPADVYWAQDAGALGALEKAGRLQTLPQELLDNVDPQWVSAGGKWIATSARARVVAYNTTQLTEADLPDSIWGFTDPKWKGKIGWPPTNGSFQAFVTALRVLEGDKQAEAWLRGILANEPKVYRNNTAAVDAVSRGEVLVAFVNHYYLYRFLAEQGESFPARNYHTKGDAGAIVNIAGAGILDVSKKSEAARRFIEFMVSKEAQEYFASESHEYPVAHVDEIPSHPERRPLRDIDMPDLDLRDLDDLEGTLDMLMRVGVL